MADEIKKEEKAPEVPAPKQAEAPQPAADAVQAAGTPEAKKEETAPAKVERPDNCVGCKKSIKKKRWYYRDGLYYCTKRCWSTTTKKAAKPEEKPAAS